MAAIVAATACAHQGVGRLHKGSGGSCVSHLTAGLVPCVHRVSVQRAGFLKAKFIESESAGGGACSRRWRDDVIPDDTRAEQETNLGSDRHRDWITDVAAKLWRAHALEPVCAGRSPLEEPFAARF
jgi:hypothetical protein